MNNDTIVTQYFAEYIRRGFLKIFNEQRMIAANKIYGKQAYTSENRPRSRSGRLQKALESPSLNITEDTSGITAAVNYPTYIRFLDMKRLGNYRIYNRPIWGILYKETFRDIRYEFRQWLVHHLKTEISESYQQ